MRFLRSHKPNKSTRASKVEKVPPEIEEKMQKDPLKHGHYFDLWLAHGENWGKVVVFEKSYLKNLDQFTDQGKVGHRGPTFGLFEECSGGFSNLGQQKRGSKDEAASP